MMVAHQIGAIASRLEGGPTHNRQHQSCLAFPVSTFSRFFFAPQELGSRWPWKSVPIRRNGASAFSS